MKASDGMTLALIGVLALGASDFAAGANAVAGFNNPRIGAASGPPASLTTSSSHTGAADSEAAAKKNWRAQIAKNPVSGQGCFHASYPSYVWESVSCQSGTLVQGQSAAAATAAAPSAGVSAAVAAGVTGATHDYVAQAQGLITYAAGELVLFGVSSEQSVDAGAGGILGPNEYTLQINTNADASPPTVCRNYSGCHVWQQFVYATDVDRKHHHGAVYMEYWIYNWGGFASYAPCPAGFIPIGSDCLMNSNFMYLRNIPVTELGDVSFTASATPGGQDVVTLFDGAEAVAVTADDNVLQIGTVWNQAEFNIFGDAAGSEAVFNQGSSIDVILSLADGSDSAPGCLGGAGTTLETNNLNLGPCQSFVFFGPTIKFTESTTRLLRNFPIQILQNLVFSVN